MLVLTRRRDEAIVIAGDIVITVLAVEGDKVKLGIQAPASITVLRQELCDAVRSQNLAAARYAPEGAAAGAAQPDINQTLNVLRHLLATPQAPPAGGSADQG